MIYDVAIIGGGPAGLTAAIYCARANKKVIVFEKNILGGKITETPIVENIPGFTAISGIEFGEALAEQAETCGVELQYEEIISIDPHTPRSVILTTSTGEKFSAITCILATGTVNRQLNVAGEQELIGNGLAFCATCDGPLFKGQDIAMVGGGNSAITEALLLSDIANHVTIIQNLPNLTAEAKLIERIEQKNNVDYLYNITVEAFAKTADKIEMTISTPAGKNKLLFDGVFESIGLIPANRSFANAVNLDKDGFISTKSDTTSLFSNIFACGDCTDEPLKQVVVACAAGARAGISAIRYIKSLN